MTKHRKILYLVSAALLIFVIALSILQTRQESPLSALSFQVGEGESSQRITLWEDADGNGYVFLPAFAELDRVQICLDTAETFNIGELQLEDGMNCASFQWNTAYELRCTCWGIPRKKTITFLRSENVAAMFLDTASGSMDYIHEKKGNEETGNVTLYRENGTVHYAGALESVNGRGNNTWEAFEKKPYSIKLTQEADLLGMGAAQKWILLANADDASHLRNKIVYDFADTVGLSYSPDSDWVDLYLNGEYAGLYLLCERNEIHPERVAVAQDSFLVSMERYDRLDAQNYPYVATENNQYLRLHSAADGEETAQIGQTLQSVENALLAEDGIDSVTGKHWEELIDTDSWVKKYLVEEVFASGDACYISQFFYTNGTLDGKVYAGPVWDFDHSIASPAGWQLQYPNTLYANRLHVKDGFDTPWFYSLYQKPEFREQMKETYASVYLPAMDTLLTETIPAYADRIATAAAMNRVRWSQPDVSTQEEATTQIGFMRERVAFLNDLWLQDGKYHIIKADQGFGAFYGYILVKPGETFDGLPVFADTPTSNFVGWYHKDTNEPFDAAVPVTGDLELYAKWEASTANKLDDYLKLAPLGFLALLGAILLWVEIKRNGKGR